VPQQLAIAATRDWRFHSCFKTREPIPRTGIRHIPLAIS
jgi:hypothetical protein